MQMPSFVGRERELCELDAAYSSDSFQFAVVYGRRRVGKTSLLRTFVANKPKVCFFTALETTIGDNVRLLNKALSEIDPAFGLMTPEPTTNSICNALTAAFEIAQKERLVLVIDEYPYLAACYPGISSFLQVLIDQNRESNKLFLILCGSSMSFMEHQVMGYKSPLYGRRTLQIKLKPFSIFDAKKMLPQADPQKLVELYAAVGGIPMYLSQFDDSDSTAGNLAKHVLRQGAYLHIEPENYLLQEVRNPAIYNAVISAIANGYVRPKEIADTTGLNSPQVSQLLDALAELQLVERVTPQVHAKKRQVFYRIGDNLFRFWYYFIPKYAGALEVGLEDKIASAIIKTDFPTFVGPVFEDICRQWLAQQVANGNLDILFKGIGTWWGTNPQTKQQEEIDIVFESIDNGLIVGECKWRNEAVDADVLDTLLRRGTLLGERIEQYYLFSKEGFTDNCRQRAAAIGNVELVTLKEMLG